MFILLAVLSALCFISLAGLVWLVIWLIANERESNRRRWYR